MDAEGRGLNLEEKEARGKCRQEIGSLEKTNESFWRQKSRNKLIKLGDKNSRFFQIYANRYKRNFHRFY